MNLKFKKLNKSAIQPSYMKDGDAGLDLIATTIVKNSLFSVWYNTDVAIEIPKNHFGMLLPRSSITNDGNLHLANSVGILDSGFRGGIQLRFNRTLKGFFTKQKYNVGDKIAQLIIVPFKNVTLEEVEHLSKTNKNTGKYGSTNKTMT